MYNNHVEITFDPDKNTRNIAIMIPKPDPELIDDDAPEWTDEDFARARPAAEVLPEIFGQQIAEQVLKNKGGRPKAVNPKQTVTIRLDSDIVAAFKKDGPGWQTRINKALRRLVHSRRKAA